VIQRVPVRIALDPAELRAHPLRIGLSMEVKVDIDDQQVKPASDSKALVSQTEVFEQLNSAVESEIAQLIKSNLGKTSTPAKKVP
jgi:membrane fusion protein, multidrug efflux system